MKGVGLVKAESTEVVTEGDMDIRHPACRTPVLITGMRYRRAAHQESYLYVEAICPSCDCYVRLSVRPELAI